MDNNNRIYYSNNAKMHSIRKNSALIVLALGIGAAIALMFAPNSGEKTREDLAHGLEQGVNKGHDMTDPTLKRLEKEMAELRQKLEEKVDEVRKA